MERKIPIILFITFVLLILLSSCVPSGGGRLNISFSVLEGVDKVEVGDVLTFQLDVEPNYALTTGEIRINDVTISAGDTFPIVATWTAEARGYYTAVGIVKSHLFGEMRSDEINFKVMDGTPPIITEIEIVPNKPEPGEPMNVFIDAEDPDSDRFFVELNVDDDVFTYSSWFDSRPFIIPVDENLDEGYHILRVTVQNEGGLDTTTSTVFKVMRRDGVLPYINVECPDVVFDGDRNSKCTVEVRDMESGIKKIKVLVDSTTVMDETFEDPWKGTYSFTIDLPSTPIGNHSIEVSAWDDYGNPRKESRVYTVKSVSSFNVNLVITGDLVSGEYITITASHDSLSDIIASTFTVDCAMDYCLPIEKRGMLQGVWKAIGGTHSIGVILKDSSGKIGSAVETIHVEDDVGPVFEVIEPSNNAGRITISSNTSFFIEMVATDTGDGMIPNGEANALIIRGGLDIVDIITLSRESVDVMGKVCRFTGVGKPIDAVGEYELRITVKDNSNNESVKSFILEVR